jgi:hypothetical protein
MTEVQRKVTPHPVPEGWPADGIHHQPEDPPAEGGETPPTEGGADAHPDNELPGGSSEGRPDQGLPDPGPQPDHELPGGSARPGHDLPPSMGPKLHGDSAKKHK